MCRPKTDRICDIHSLPACLSFLIQILTVVLVVHRHLQNKILKKYSGCSSRHSGLRFKISLHMQHRYINGKT